MTEFLKLDLNFNAVRKAVVNTIQYATRLDQNHVIVTEPEKPNEPRPTLPYMGMKITTAAGRYGDDTKQNLLGPDGKPSSVWNSGGPRKMIVSFQAYAESHEDAYNLMSLWQTCLDEETTQQMLIAAGISVLIIGTVVDLTALLNTGYEGRANLDCQFGLAMNLTSDLGEIDTVTVEGAVDTGQETVVTIATTVTNSD